MPKQWQSGEKQALCLMLGVILFVLCAVIFCIWQEIKHPCLASESQPCIQYYGIPSHPHEAHCQVCTKWRD